MPKRPYTDDRQILPQPVRAFGSGGGLPQDDILETDLQLVLGMDLQGNVPFNPNIPLLVCFIVKDRRTVIGCNRNPVKNHRGHRADGGDFQRIPGTFSRNSNSSNDAARS